MPAVLRFDAVLADFPIRVAAVGTVQALNTVDVKVRVDGQLQHVAFSEGQDVEFGQLLAQLDQGPLTAQLHRQSLYSGFEIHVCSAAFEQPHQVIAQTFIVLIGHAS